MQKTHQSALQVQQKAEALLQANHYDMDMIRDCAEKVRLFFSFIQESMNNNQHPLLYTWGMVAVMNPLAINSFVIWLEGGGPLATADVEDGR